MRFALALACVSTCIPPVAHGQSPDGGDRVIATLLGNDVLLKSVTPESASAKRQTMKPAEYADWLRGYRANLMLYRICGPVKKDYAIREKLEPSDAELDRIIATINGEHRAYLATLSEEELQKFGIRIFWLKGAAADWRTAKAMHAKSGGRVGISSFGACTAIDGLVAVLEEYENRGDLAFHDAELERAFWEKAKRSPFTDVVLRPERVEKHFAVSPWERWRRELAVQAIRRGQRRD